MAMAVLLSPFHLAAAAAVAAAASASSPAPSSSALCPLFRSSLAPLHLHRFHSHHPPMASSFDTASFEADRLRLDAQARLDMMQIAEAAQQEPNGDADVENPPPDGAWKWAIRKRIWDLMERENIAQHPRPVHHRIPNFVGAGAAAAKLASLPAFQAAKCVKVNPDTPQKQVRYLTLEAKKKLLTPQPRLRTGFFSELEAAVLPAGVLQEACTAVGVAKYGKPLGIDAKLKVDLIVIGSVAVDPKTGARLGKGEGFAELEYGMLRYMGAIDDSTLVVTSIHDKQLVDDIPVEKLQVHDVPVDVICTPTHIIFTNTAIPKPKGIYWEKLSPEKLGQIRILQELKQRIEKETGQVLPSGPSERLPPTAERRTLGRRQKSERRSSVDGSSAETTSTDSNRRIFVWNLDISTTWKELRDHVAKSGGDVVRVNVIRKEEKARPMARVLLKEGTDAKSLVKALDGSKLGGATVKAKIDVS